jgi:hypothetical protein
MRIWLGTGHQIIRFVAHSGAQHGEFAVHSQHDQQGSNADNVLAAELAELRQRLADLESQAAQLGEPDRRAASPADAEASFGRRLLLRRVGTVAAGAAAASVASGVLRPAAAGTGINGNMQIGAANVSNTANTPQTLLKVSSLAAADDAVFVVTDGTSATASRRAAIAGLAGAQVDTGVVGISTDSSGGVGVLGQGRVALSAASNVTHLKLTDASGLFTNLPATTALLSSTSVGGEITLDQSLNLWLGVQGSGWRKLAGPTSAGAFHAIDPWRLVDSRVTGGALNAGLSRVIPVVGVATSPIPSGARAIVGTLAVVNTTSTGYLTITAGNVSSTPAASINWFGASQILNNAFTSRLDSAGIKVFNNSVGNTDFVIDVTGYYL